MGRLASLHSRLSWTILVVLVLACQNGRLPRLPDAGVIEPADIKASSDTVAIPPGGSRQIIFHLRSSQGEPVPDTVVSFEILDDKKTPGSGGARLSLSSGLTDEQGTLTLQIIAGTGSDDQKPLRFSVRASAANASSVLPVFVTSGALASAIIVPKVESASTGEDAFTSISFRFYDDAVCADMSWDHPAPSLRPEQKMSPDEPAMFTNVVSSGNHAVLAVATGARDRVVAKGCADLPGSSLTPSQVMRVFLPLTRVHVSPLGTYQVKAEFDFAPQQPNMTSVREQWKAFSDRLCDPASLWLDCTIDALSGDLADDPIDCQPVPGEEGEIGTLLSAKRSVPGGGGTCASQRDLSGKTSLDAKTYALFPASYLPPLSLGDLPNELTLSKLSLSSTLTVAESGLADILNIRHALDTLTLSTVNMFMTISAEMLGLPIRSVWFASGQSEAGQLELSPHGFTLHLGSLARLLFYKGSLSRRLGGIADVNAFVSALFKGAGRNTRSTMLLGCDALDSLLCEEASLERGCIMSACQAGLLGLARHLDSSFAVLDGSGLDFFLSGKAALTDNDGDKQADKLDISLMTASFNIQLPTTVRGNWSAERVLPSSP